MADDGGAELTARGSPKRTLRQSEGETGLRERKRSFRVKATTSTPAAPLPSTSTPVSSPRATTEKGSKRKARSAPALHSRLGSWSGAVCEVTCIAVARNHALVGDALGRLSCVAIKTSDGHLARELADQALTNAPITSATCAPDLYHYQR